jgi:hypothetical protein
MKFLADGSCIVVSFLQAAHWLVLLRKAVDVGTDATSATKKFRFDEKANP